MSVERSLHERRRGDALRDRARLGPVGRAAHRNLRQHRRALAVGDDQLRELTAHLADAKGELLVARRRPLDAARAVRKQQHGVVRRALSVDRDRIEAHVDRGAQELDRLTRLERIVRRQYRQHRRELRVDHSRALRHAADGEARAPSRGFLRMRVRGHDRRRGVAAAVDAQRGGCLAHAADDVAERELGADHAGGEHEHFLDVEPE